MFIGIRALSGNSAGGSGRVVAAVKNTKKEMRSEMEPSFGEKEHKVRPSSGKLTGEY
jgi:hypothetical protein